MKYRIALHADEDDGPCYLIKDVETKGHSWCGDDTEAVLYGSLEVAEETATEMDAISDGPWSIIIEDENGTHVKTVKEGTD